MIRTDLARVVDDNTVDSILGPSYLKPSDVSKLFNVSESSIRKYIRDGRLRAIRVGGQHRIRISEVKRFIEKNQQVYGIDDES